MNRINEYEAIEMNRRYQELLYSEEYQSFLRKERIKNTVKSYDIKQICRMFKDRRLNRSLLCTEGNETYENRNVDLQSKTSELCRVAVYSCIVGKYDDIKEPIVEEENVDYYMFTDQSIKEDSIWKKIDICEMEDLIDKSPFMINRIIKMRPDVYLPHYDWTIYIDGTIQIVGGVRKTIEEMGNCCLGLHFHNERDCIYNEGIAVINQKKADKELLDKQIREYKELGFPSHFGLYENTIIVRKRVKYVTELMGYWLREYEKYPTRDQISLPFIMWKNDFDRSLIHILGNNINRNPRFIRHLKHRG